jgi:hypothetical protein
MQWGRKTIALVLHAQNKGCPYHVILVTINLQEHHRMNILGKMYLLVLGVLAVISVIFVLYVIYKAATSSNAGTSNHNQNK